MRRSAAVSALLLLLGCASGRPRPVFERFPIDNTPNASDYPDVPAVILLDKGTLDFTADPESKRPIARLRVNRRIKVLRPEGVVAGKVEIPVDPGTAVPEVIARRVQPDGDTYEISGSDILERPLEGGGIAKVFALPDVEVGTIVEWVYDVYFGDLRFLPPWIFRNVYPTKRSEFAAIVPPAVKLDYRFLDQGRPVDRPPERFEVEDMARLHWAAVDQPALFPEPDMPSPELVSPQVHVVVTSADVGGQRFEGFAGWDDVRRWFVERAGAWDELSDADIAEAKSVAGETSPEEQALKLTAIVARDLGWDVPVPLWRAPIVPAEAVLRAKKGNAVTRGLLLVSLLRAAGIDALPAFASYRHRGALLPDLPFVRALDAVVAVLPRPDKPLVLDPGHLTLSADVPSSELQGTRVVLLRDDTAEVIEVPISAPADSQTTVSYDLKLDREGRLRGTMEARLTGAEAGELRALLVKAEAARYPAIVSEFLARRGAGIGLENVNIADITALRRPLSVKGAIDVAGAFEAEADTQVAIPLAKLVGEGGPPLREGRRHTILAGVPRRTEVRVLLFLPDEHKAEALPPAFTAQFPGGETEISVRQETPKRLGIRRVETLSTIEIRPDDYGDFYRYKEKIQQAERGRIGISRPAPRSFQY